MSKQVSEIPHWLRSALKGTLCWIGWRRCFYKMHNLVEGAIVAEVCNIIAANMHDNQRLICEKLYKEIDSEFSIGKSKRADLAITTDDTISHVLEVKRAVSTKLYDDIARLGILKSLEPTIKTYLIVFSEGKRPEDFVNENGVAVKKMKKYKGYKYKVRAVYKVSHSFSKKEHAHYACVLEVL